MLILEKLDILVAALHRPGPAQHFERLRIVLQVRREEQQLPGVAIFPGALLEDVRLINEFGRETRLRTALKDIVEDYEPVPIP